MTVPAHMPLLVDRDEHLEAAKNHTLTFWSMESLFEAPGTVRSPLEMHQVRRFQAALDALSSVSSSLTKPAGVETTELGTDAM